MNLLILIMSLFTFPNVESSTLTLHVDNIDKLKGSIYVGVYKKADGFLKPGAEYKTFKIKVKDHQEKITISDLPKGDYAISLYHDENSDGKCNLNFLGIPKEAYGFSNNIKPKLSAPSYQDCKFSMTTDRSLRIKLID